MEFSSKVIASTEAFLLPLIVPLIVELINSMFKVEELPTINRAFDFSYQVKNEIEWVLVAAEVFEDFSIECHNWIDDEDVFIVPNYPEFELED